MSTRNFPGGKKRLARRADNLSAIYELNVKKLWEPQPLTTLRASMACTRITLPYLYYIYIKSTMQIYRTTNKLRKCFGNWMFPKRVF
jgi:hypothetical protein